MIYPKGSEWRRWDLHVHTKGTKREDKFTSNSFDAFCVTLFRKALENDIAVIGITDYLCVENYKRVCQFVNELQKNADFSDEEKSQIKNIFLIPNVELRITPVTKEGRWINIHCLFNPEIVDDLDNIFFNELKFEAGDGRKYSMNRKDIIALGKARNSELSDEAAYNEGNLNFAVTHENLMGLKKANNVFRENVIIAVSNSSSDGVSGLQRHHDLFEGKETSSLDGVRSAIYKIAHCIFSGNPTDAEYFSGQGKKDDAETVIHKVGSLKPCIHGSDAHTENKLFNPDQDRYCWVKADPTFNGLRQILYEPFPGDRVMISPKKPDQKDDFKVIRKIEFKGTNDFPREIIFNPNLCSIIGSRSAGKSALLAYLADAVDIEQARNKQPDGPGEGFSWREVDFNYSVEWANFKRNDDASGKVVYIPQNFLYEMSGKPEEINKKIFPVLIRRFPQIGVKYANAERDIKDINEEINNTVEKWFLEKSNIEEINDKLQDLGSKSAVQAEKEKTERKITNIREKFQLNTDEISKLKDLTEKVAEFENNKAQFCEELEKIGKEGKKGEYFRKGEISLTPSFSQLPDALQAKLNKKLDELKEGIIGKANNIVSEYNAEIEKKLADVEGELNKAIAESEDLKKRQEKSGELKSLMEKSGELKATLTKINGYTKKLTEINRRLSLRQKEITSLLKRRTGLIKDLKKEIKSLNQSDIKDMIFGLEAEIQESDYESLQQKINTKETTDFVSSHTIQFEKIRSNPAAFLEAMVSGEQKINRGYNKQSVATVIKVKHISMIFGHGSWR
jgi:hypothetical protein